VRGREEDLRLALQQRLALAQVADAQHERVGARAQPAHAPAAHVQRRSAHHRPDLDAGQALEICVDGGTITADGVLDFRGTLAVDRAAPVGFREIALRFDLDAPGATEQQLATLVKLTERYCVVLQTLRGTPELTVDLT